MPLFSAASREQLATCDPRLQRLFNEVIKHYDCKVLEGHRGQAAQEAAFRAGNSKLHYPFGNHNKLPSMAADVAPWPVQWPDESGLTVKQATNRLLRFHLFAGFVKGVASQQGLKIRWGGDWDSDWDLLDQTFNDLPHFEILGP
jgi:peptidoglycan L-alanyl-D-glutamate endopeptidase CwlK